MLKIMLSVVLILSAFALISANDAGAMLRRVRESSQVCIVQSNVKPSQLIRLSMMQVTDDKEPFCYLACIAKALGIMTEHNKFSKENILIIYNNLKPVMETTMYDKLLKVTDKCLAEVRGGGTECDVARAAFACITKYGKQEKLFN